MDKLENCADCGKKLGFTERIFSKTNGLWICEDCAITQIQENDNKDQKIADLEAKLAESENEIEKLKIILSSQAVQVPEAQRVNLITANCVQYNPNQTAIAELEKVVEFIKEYPHEPRYWNIVSYIDQQIKLLKGEIV